MVQHAALDPSPAGHAHALQSVANMARQSRARPAWAAAGLLRPVKAGDVGSTQALLASRLGAFSPARAANGRRGGGPAGGGTTAQRSTSGRTEDSSVEQR
ncbi:hypothetical protein HBH96_019450 [Parastagonospora nodorum]|nr:hypothetical protein HBH96_019450 [Parastagonospora nodorum]